MTERVEAFAIAAVTGIIIGVIVGFVVWTAYIAIEPEPNPPTTIPTTVYAERTTTP